jgi:methylated-DNA-[protein]-cysteine S-methyltransferase
MDACFDAILAAPFGALGVRTADGTIAEIVFLPPGTAARAPRDELAAAACAQLAAYLDNPAVRFDLPLSNAGTSFQRRVWQGIAAIPRGQTLTYGALAAQLASVPRAVGQACGRNPFPVVVPCHRVVAAHGRYLLEAKRWLLRHEGAL